MSTPHGNGRGLFRIMTKRGKKSAGLLMFRKREEDIEVFLVHPGGPFWAKKDAGAWTVPKGEIENDEEPLATAEREFTEETGFIARGPFFELGSVTQKSGKVVLAWAFEGDCDPEDLKSNTCQIEWPPRSKRLVTIPEVDRGEWFTPSVARTYLRAEQHAFLSRLEEKLRQ